MKNVSLKLGDKSDKRLNIRADQKTEIGSRFLW